MTAHEIWTVSQRALQQLPHGAPCLIAAVTSKYTQNVTLVGLVVLIDAHWASQSNPPETDLSFSTNLQAQLQPSYVLETLLNSFLGKIRGGASRFSSLLAKFKFSLLGTTAFWVGLRMRSCTSLHFFNFVAWLHTFSWENFSCSWNSPVGRLSVRLPQRQEIQLKEVSRRLSAWTRWLIIRCIQTCYALAPLGTYSAILFAAAASLKRLTTKVKVLIRLQLEFESSYFVCLWKKNVNVLWISLSGRTSVSTAAEKRKSFVSLLCWLYCEIQIYVNDVFPVLCVRLAPCSPLHNLL